MGKTVAAVAGLVVAIGIAIAAPYLIPIVAGALGTSTLVATAVVAVGAALVSAGLSIALNGALVAGAPKTPVGPPSVFRQSISNSFIIYGKRRVGGLLVFFHSKQGSTGAHWRYFVVAVAGHRCKGVVSFMLNDEVVTVDGAGMVTSGKYANNAWLWFQRGQASETANATFVAECDGKWTSAHKGNGVAAIYAKFKLEDDVPDNGMPNITAIIEGKDDILDPRTGTSGYSRNAALVFYDWLKLPREEGGFGAYADEIPDNAWISAQANVCDETVNGQPRYAIDAVITTGSPPVEVREALLVNCAGSYTYSGGKHLMRPGYYVPASATLSEDDLSGPIQVTPLLSGDRAASEVQGTFVDPNTNYQAAAFNRQAISPEATDVRQLDLDLAFTTNRDQANRVARIMLNRANAEKTVVWPMNIAGVGVRALDTVQLASTRYGLDNYAWSVAGWSLTPDWSVVLSLREENADIYGAPALASPVTPPTVTQPSPLLTLGEIQTILRNTYAKYLTVSASDAGSNATVSLSAFTLDYPAPYYDVAVAAHNYTGKAYSTTYYPYLDVDAPGDTTPTFGITTTYGDSLNSTANPYRISLGRSITTPAAGGAGTSGGTAGGGYSGGGTGGGGVIP